MEKSKKTQVHHTNQNPHICKQWSIPTYKISESFHFTWIIQNSHSHSPRKIADHIESNACLCFNTYQTIINQYLTKKNETPFFFSSFILIFGSKITESKWITTKKTRKRMPLQRDRRIIHRIERRIENLPVEHGRQGEIWGIVKNNEERRRVEGSKPKRGAFETGYEVSLAVGKIHWFRSLSFFHIYEEKKTM